MTDAPRRDRRRIAAAASRSGASSPIWATPRAGEWCARCRSSWRATLLTPVRIYAARSGGPEQLRKNLARVLGVTPDQVPDGLIRASLASYARYWREAFRLPSMDLTRLRRAARPALCGQGAHCRRT